MKFQVFLLAVMLVLAGCGQGVTGGSGLFEEESKVNGWLFKVVAEPGNDVLEVTLELKNETGQEAAVDFSSGQTYELVLTNQEGEEVYRFSEGKMFTMALVHKKVAEGESIVFEESIPTSDFELGVYSLQAELLVAAVNNEVPEDSFKQTIDVEIK
ncbi:BsuPI-related putative proteinase inhibitor [Bacillus solitudinis]|uniref:BsuPI-related putative proteinase inhibitor n=1 Tax=Bacillus solitudinis TaxID=2014074 RepID=UPI000C234039|nr:BsuPI-related putative proteinase inhibitor [Bacillus solitudinis]